MLSDDDMAEIAACGPDPEVHREMIGRFEEAGCDHVYVHQIGPDQDGFVDFYERELLPASRKQPARPDARGSGSR